MRMEDPFNVYVTGQNYSQVKIFEPRLTLNLLCFLALIIHELFRAKRQRKLRNNLGSNILT